MFLIWLLFASFTFSQVTCDSKSPPSPLFEFWNPLTWIDPKYSSEAKLQILRDTRDSQGKGYEQLKKALLPANVFFRNIRAQFEGWDESKKPKKSKGSHQRNGKKPKTTT